MALAEHVMADRLRRLASWRWFPFVGLVTGALLYVVFAVALVPESFTPAREEAADDDIAGASGAPGSQNKAQKPRFGARSSVSRKLAKPRSIRRGGMPQKQEPEGKSARGSASDF